MAREGDGGGEKQKYLALQRYCASQHDEIIMLASVVAQLQMEIFGMRERERLSVAEVMRRLTGGDTQKGCGCGEDPCLHGIPAAVGSDEFPLTHRPGEYMGIPREPLRLPIIIDPRSIPLEPPPPATDEPDELRELYEKLIQAAAACKRLIDERDGGR